MQPEFIVPIIIIAVVVILLIIITVLSYEKRNRNKEVDVFDTRKIDDSVVGRRIEELEEKLKEFIVTDNLALAQKDFPSLYQEQAKKLLDLSKKVDAMNEKYTPLAELESARHKMLSERINKLRMKVKPDEHADKQPSYYLDSEDYDSLKLLEFQLTYKDVEPVIHTGNGPVPLIRYASPLTAMEEKAMELHTMAKEIYKDCCKL